MVGPPHHCPRYQGHGIQGLTPQHPVPPAPSKPTLVPVVRLTPCPLLPAAPLSLPGQRRVRGAGQEGDPIGMDGRGDTGGWTEQGPPQQARGGTSLGSRAGEIAVLWDGSPLSRHVQDSFVPLRTENWWHVPVCSVQGTAAAQPSPAVCREPGDTWLLPPGLWRGAQWAQPHAPALILAQDKDLQGGDAAGAVTLFFCR